MTITTLSHEPSRPFVYAARKEQFMKRTFCIRSCRLLAILTLASGTIFAQTSVLYPDQGTTLNGKAVYVSAFLHPGDEVQTGRARAKVDFGGNELEMAPHSVLTVGSPMIVKCGETTVLFGNIAFEAGSTPTVLGAGQAMHAASGECANSLPDAPGFTQTDQDPAPASWWRRSSRVGAPAAGSGLRFDSPVSDGRFWEVNAAMFSSSIVNVEMATRCLAQKTCADVPSPCRSRWAMYGLGLPADGAVSYLGYYLKRRGNRWWFVPSVAVTFANAYVAYHWAGRVR